MGGRYGGELVTVVSLEIVYIDEEKHLIFVRGCVPGRSRGILKLKPTTRKKKRVEHPFQIHSINQGEEPKE